MEQQDLKKLLEDCRAGSESAWRAFIAEFHALISGTAAREYGTDSEDVAQNVYEKLLSGNCRLLERFDGCYEQFLVYLMRISKNVSLSAWKKRARGRFQSSIDEIREDALAYDAGIEDGLIREEEHEWLMEAIYGLKPKYREVIIYLKKGYNHREVAELTGLPVNTVLTRAARAKELLKKTLKIEIKAV
ncbi:MAG: RNA polymerase sigma factor [Spirochaetes bacterium]|jgi:RNA polymerase sigma factor (sigma-70 family)|nr:RNA polymerase sigma factor [Spirochaetota bacterium]